MILLTGCRTNDSASYSCGRKVLAVTRPLAAQWIICSARQAASLSAATSARGCDYRYRSKKQIRKAGLPFSHGRPGTTVDADERIHNLV